MIQPMFAIVVDGEEFRTSTAQEKSDWHEKYAGRKCGRQRGHFSSKNSPQQSYIYIYLGIYCGFSTEDEMRGIYVQLSATEEYRSNLWRLSEYPCDLRIIFGHWNVSYKVSRLTSWRLMLIPQKKLSSSCRVSTYYRMLIEVPHLLAVNWPVHAKQIETFYSFLCAPSILSVQPPRYASKSNGMAFSYTICRGGHTLVGREAIILE